MVGARAESVITFLLHVDRDVLLYILPVDLFFAIAVVAVLSKGRRWMEIAAIFVTAYISLFVFASFLFTVVLDRPFILFEMYTFP